MGCDTTEEYIPLFMITLVNNELFSAINEHVYRDVNNASTEHF
jgi:hypothetical protein